MTKLRGPCPAKRDAGGVADVVFPDVFDIRATESSDNSGWCLNTI